MKFVKIAKQILPFRKKVNSVTKEFNVEYNYTDIEAKVYVSESLNLLNCLKDYEDYFPFTWSPDFPSNLQ